MEFTLTAITKRLTAMVFVWITVSIIIFFTTQLLPGDIAVMKLGQHATPEALAALRGKWGLNEPVYSQYFSWITSFARGDFGKSLSMMEVEIHPLLFHRLKNSSILAVLAFGVIAIVGISFGVIGALKKGSLLDGLVTLFAYAGMSTPEFVTGVVLIMLLCGVVFNILPSYGYVELSKGFFPWIKHLILPIFTTSILLLAYVMRMTRVNMIEVLQKDYVRTARLKGLSERVVIFRHVLRNALIPTVTLIFLNLGWLVGGLVIVENVFAYPGVGRLILQAINMRDIPLLQASAMSVASVYILANFLADLVCGWLNPKLRVPKE